MLFFIIMFENRLKILLKHFTDIGQLQRLLARFQSTSFSDMSLAAFFFLRELLWNLYWREDKIAPVISEISNWRCIDPNVLDEIIKVCFYFKCYAGFDSLIASSCNFFYSHPRLPA